MCAYLGNLASQTGGESPVYVYLRQLLQLVRPGLVATELFLSFFLYISQLSIAGAGDADELAHRHAEATGDKAWTERREGSATG